MNLPGFSCPGAISWLNIGVFTGLVQSIGSVVSLNSGRLELNVPTPHADPWNLGESIAVNGCCLTVAEIGKTLSFDLSPETLARTALARLESGAVVNIERAMKASDRFGGHFVQGHVDGVGQIFSIEKLSDSHVFAFSVGEVGNQYLVDKGSVCIDGISLTVNSPQGGHFLASIIPHTFENTNLRFAKSGDIVNVEFDILAKHVANLVGVYELRNSDTII